MTSMITVILLSLLPVLFVFAEPAPKDPCQKTCLLNADCGIGGQCTGGTCSYKTQYCANDRWSVNERGEKLDCGAYLCEQKTGACLSEAQDSGACTTGYVHDGQLSCVKSINCNSADPVCAELEEKWKVTRKNWEVLNPEPNPSPFSCQSCDESAPCDSGKMCWNKRCVPNAHYCSLTPSGEEVSRNQDTVLQVCGEYRCNLISGDCRASCTDDSHCQTGLVCSKDRRCISK